MHDFCFTIPYGMAVVCGGVIVYATNGRAASLGLGGGLLLLLAGYLSLQAFRKRTNSFFAWILETAINMDDGTKILANWKHNGCWDQWHHDNVLSLQNCDRWKPYCSQG